MNYQEVRQTAWGEKNGQKAMVELLQQRGAQANLSFDPPWATSFAWDLRRENDEIAELLWLRGAT